MLKFTFLLAKDPHPQLVHPVLTIEALKVVDRLIRLKNYFIVKEIFIFLK